jgi:hypothetical protein
MKNLDTTLPDLMRRATENLEPTAPDLVAHGIRRGKVLRRRRTALAGLTGAAAVLATVGLVAGSTQLFSGPVEAPVSGSVAAPAGASAGTTSTRPHSEQPVTPAETLQTLSALLPKDLAATNPTTGGGYGLGANEATVLLDDGKGASLLTLTITTAQPTTNCNPFPPDSCKIQADGSVYVAWADQPLYTDRPNPGGIKQTTVELFHPNGTQISLSNYNAPKDKDTGHSRPSPILSVAQLTQIASSTRWVFPPRQAPGYVGKPDPDNPATGQPTIPLQQTLATLKKVLPSGLHTSKPVTWGGGKQGFNGASYVVDDGRGASIVTALVQLDYPKTTCEQERGYVNCSVRPDGSVVSSTRDEKEPARRGGALCNLVEIAHPDGRRISMESCNAPKTADAEPTRSKPIFTVDQLVTLAGAKTWKFPGTGVR